LIDKFRQQIGAKTKIGKTKKLNPEEKEAKAEDEKIIDSARIGCQKMWTKYFSTKYIIPRGKKSSR